MKRRVLFIFILIFWMITLSTFLSIRIEQWMMPYISMIATSPKDVNKEIPADSLFYDDMGMRRHLIGWNAALDENLNPEDIEVIDDGSSDYPWEHSPIKLNLRGWRAPYSYAPYPQKTMEPYAENGYAYISEEMPLTLIPYGCTALRISCFPRADLRKKEK